MKLESCRRLVKIQQKKELSKTDGLGPRYKQPCRAGLHVDTGCLKMIDKKYVALRAFKMHQIKF